MRRMEATPNDDLLTEQLSIRQSVGGKRQSHQAERRTHTTVATPSRFHFP